MAKGKYTAAQKKAYAKRMAAKRMANKKKPKKAVIKQNQFRTEFKDRVSPISNYTIAQNPTDWTESMAPQDSVVMFPHALFNYFQQGNKNGQVDGNQINARYLNMKVELDFSDLPVIVRTSDGTIPAIDQNYNIYIRQCLILQDISEHLTKGYLNASSGRTQPAFNGILGGPNPELTPLELVHQTAHRALNRSKVKAPFLTYERRQDTKVRVLKKIKVKGDLNERFGTENMASAMVTVANPDSPPADPPVYALKTRPYSTPNQHFTFNWKMPKAKVQLQPAIGTTSGDPPVTELAGYFPGKMWLPCVMVSCERDIDDFDIDIHPLRIKQISHFTYTDN